MLQLHNNYLEDKLQSESIAKRIVERFQQSALMKGQGARTYSPWNENIDFVRINMSTKMSLKRLDICGSGRGGYLSDIFCRI